MKPTAHTLVLGLGNPWRGDDGVGPVVARRLRAMNLPDVEVREASGEGAALIEAWKNFTNVIVVDAAHSGAEPGTIHQIEANHAPVPSKLFHYSTHAFSVAEAVELARALGALPPRLILLGVEGRDFTAGAPLSSEVAAAVDDLAGRIQAETKRSLAGSER